VSAKQANELTYEQAVERLEAIVARIESGDAGLEESIALYEEGVALGKHCNDVLTRAQQRVDELGKNGCETPVVPAAGRDPEEA
jgi:exodeoxyribonuclease VII small subunit